MCRCAKENVQMFKGANKNAKCADVQKKMFKCAKVQIMHNKMCK